jgi:hypothetical protein
MQWRYHSIHTSTQHYMEASGQLNILAALPPQNQSWYLLNIRLGGPHIWSDALKRRKI